VIPIVTAEEMRAIDAGAPVSIDDLIARAGWEVARSATEMLGGTYGRIVNVVAGGGNNGADGRVAADLLRRRGVKVRLFEAAHCPAVLPAADLVVDAVFGTGYGRRHELCDQHDERSDGDRRSWTPPDVGSSLVLAVDIPSGLDSLTGLHDGAVLAADRTVTFQALKAGLLLGDGASLCGSVQVADIGLDMSRATAHLVERGDVSRWWPWRPDGAHKWNNAVRVVAGSDGMLGAARLCSAGALRAGAGLVSASSPGLPIGARDEIVQPPIAASGWADEVLADLARFGSLVVGPGLGRADTTIDEVRRVIARANVPLVVDGDALFAAGCFGDVGALVGGRSHPTVLTPHDGEFAALTGSKPASDRLGAVRHLAGELGCTVLLKGPTTVVADQSGEVLVVDRGDERLATAGSGDVLAGMIASMLASGVPPLQSAACAAWVHGELARTGPSAGIAAMDLVEALPAVLTGLSAEARP
jgi:ADP-dependent NAD(P)H-hydrate dehydratase / NAD(P)H-hydrate epimerase